MNTRISTLLLTSSIAVVSFIVAGEARAMEYGLTPFACIAIDASSFEKEATDVGSSCTTIGRKGAARKDAERELAEEADAVCGEIYDASPSFYAWYCDAVCQYNGYESGDPGVYACDTTITDEDTWAGPATCFTGLRQYNRLTADVACGCQCNGELTPIP